MCGALRLAPTMGVMTTTARRPRPVLESSLESYFADQVRRRLMGRTEKFMPTRKGMPDRVVLLPGGRVYLVELKRGRKDGGRLSPAQELWIERAAALGTTVHVLWGREGIDRWVAERLDRWDDELITNPATVAERCRGVTATGRACRRTTTSATGLCSAHLAAVHRR